jgi:hypothetical protein
MSICRHFTLYFSKPEICGMNLNDVGLAVSRASLDRD